MPTLLLGPNKRLIFVSQRPEELQKKVQWPFFIPLVDWCYELDFTIVLSSVWPELTFSNFPRVKHILYQFGMEISMARCSLYNRLPDDDMICSEKCAMHATLWNGFCIRWTPHKSLTSIHHDRLTTLNGICQINFNYTLRNPYVILSRFD